MKIKWRRIIIVLLLLILIGTGIYFFFFTGENKNGLTNPDHGEVNNPEEPIVKKLQVFDLESNTRPISVMINNHKDAQPYQSGLNDAYMVYEIITEGGITRMLALFKDADLDRIGPIRSSRHYFLDYALENNALYAHHGWSPQAQTDIALYDIDNVEVDDYKYGWRDDSVDANYEHTLVTSYEDMMTKASDVYNYETEINIEPLLNYDVDNIDINEMEGALSASSVTIKYSSYQTNEWKYNEETKMYEKYSNETLRKDYITGEVISAKNIITYQVRNYSIDNYGRQDIENIGSGTGYYITNGYAVPIRWSKSDMDEKTIYTYLDGTEITVNDGITHIQIQPVNQTISIK